MQVIACIEEPVVIDKILTRFARRCRVLIANAATYRYNARAHIIEPAPHLNWMENA